MTGKISIIIFILLITIACAAPFREPSATPLTPTKTPRPTLNSLPLPTATLTPAPSPAGLDRVNIYLVAIGDNGASGKYIGCGDSLVPVEIPIEPTLGVLRAAINELFKLAGQQTYGQSGLYNALYLSDLNLESVEVIDAEARIALSGSLIFGGECDIPRIEEQLYALALQFPTVETVSITVNGELLENLLDLRG